jgi:hypothetical protein
VTGTDSNGGPIPPPGGGTGCANETVSIADVGPTAGVVKTVDSLQCVLLRYKVDVTNTDPAESLSLTALSDYPFGSITSVHGNVQGTTCGLNNGVGTLTPPAGTNNGAGVLCVLGQTCTSNAYIAPKGHYACYFDADSCSGSNTNTVTATLSDGDKHCSGGTVPEPPPPSGEMVCFSDADCSGATPNCVPNQITQDSNALTVNVAVTGHCSDNASLVCLVDANCPTGGKCMIP